jgi:hypothetical protein
MATMPRAATRLVRLEDAAVLADLVCRNREFMSAWDPIRPVTSPVVVGFRP